MTSPGSANRGDRDLILPPGDLLGEELRKVFRYRAFSTVASAEKLYHLGVGGSRKGKRITVVDGHNSPPCG